MFHYIAAFFLVALLGVGLLIGPHRRWMGFVAAWALLWSARAIEVLIYSKNIPADRRPIAQYLMITAAALTMVWIVLAWRSRARKTPDEMRHHALRRVCLLVGSVHLAGVTYYALPVGYVLSPFGANLVADGALTLVTMGVSALYAHRTGRSWIAWWIASFFGHGLPAVVLGLMAAEKEE